MVKGICDSQSGCIFKGNRCFGVSGDLLRKGKGSRQGEGRGGGVRRIVVRSTWRWKRRYDKEGVHLVTVSWKLVSWNSLYNLVSWAPNLMASHLWTQSTNLNHQQVGYIREREKMPVLNQNQTLRTNGQDERTASSGFIGDPQQSLSSEGAGLGRTANSPVYEANFNSQFIGMMLVCHYVILLLVIKHHLRTQDKTKGQAEANCQGHKPQREH